MTWFILGAIVGALVKTLLPWPFLDDRVREAWRWIASKIP